MGSGGGRGGLANESGSCDIDINSARERRESRIWLGTLLVAAATTTTAAAAATRCRVILISIATVTANAKRFLQPGPQ